MAKEPIVGPNFGSQRPFLPSRRHRAPSVYSDVEPSSTRFIVCRPSWAGMPFTLCAQSAEETSNWTDAYWNDHLNPGGIGITFSGQQS